MNKKDVIKKAKEVHDGDLFLADYTITDRDGNDIELVYAYREPTAAEMQIYREMQEKDDYAANHWLMKALIVAPDGVVDKIGGNQVAVAVFYQDYLNPLFGKLKSKQPLMRI